MIVLTRQTLHALVDAEATRHGRPNPGLLLRRGMVAMSPAGQAGAAGDTAGRQKEKVIGKVVDLPCSPEYAAAYARWRRAVGDDARFSRTELEVDGRLYIGLVRDNPLETGVAVNHTYGMPLIPGSSIKGVVRAAAMRWLKDRADANAFLFGRGGEGPDETEAGGVVFHDAWWVPEGEGKPFVPEVVTPHHRDYYNLGSAHATDFDDPVPAPQIAVRGRFLFVVEGEGGWRELAMRLLTLALTECGVGGKTTSGYGRFRQVDRQA